MNAKVPRSGLGMKHALLCGAFAVFAVGVAGGGCRGMRPRGEALEAQTPSVTPRTLTVINQCPFDVWIGSAGGAAGPCQDDGGCGVSQQCNSGNNTCFWVLPQPTSGEWQLGADGGTAVFTLPAASYVPPDASVSIQWSGNLFGSTGCATNAAGVLVCDTAGCGSSPCAPGVGGTPPATQAEFTLQNNAQDFYDVEIINGVNIPLQMVPDPDGGYLANKDAYWCGNPGSATPGNSALTGCGWQLNPPSAAPYQFVSPGGSACSSNSDCQTGTVCGLSVPAVAPGGNGQATCGRFLGYWSAVSVCGLNPNFGVPFNCASTVPADSGTYGNLTNLYGCVVPASSTTLTGAQSCYSADAAATCCGCQQWPYPADISCQNSNTAWTSNVLPKLSFLKDACPTAYTYQYDDKTSTFNCQSGTTPNNVSYTVTYCPGGTTGAPDAGSMASPRKRP